MSMALMSNSPSPPPLSLKRFAQWPALAPKKPEAAFDVMLHGTSLAMLERYPQEDSAVRRIKEAAVLTEGESFDHVENSRSYGQMVSLGKPQDADGTTKKVGGLMHEGGMRGSDSLSADMVNETKMSRKVMRKRPARIVIPESCERLGFSEVCEEKESVGKEVEVEGSEYCLASRKGCRRVMEDGYGVITNIHGDSRQAFFGVYDGHGGRAAVDFVSQKLGENILAAVAELEEEDQLESAIRAGYLTTDREFVSLGVRGGACVATVLLKDAELHVSNVGDCRVVMSRKGDANALTEDHRAEREDERIRVESSGGFVNCCNGVWRVQDSLAVSRAIGDGSMKQWIISDPETKRIRLTLDCEFLIMASDGLWDKVTNQEAVDVVMRCKNFIQSCKDLVDISRSRGSRDDITVMVVDLTKFVQDGD